MSLWVPRTLDDWAMNMLVAGAAPSKHWPTSAAEMAAAIGYGTWASGYLLDESDSPCADSYGSANLSKSGSPLFQQPGAFTGDLAVACATGAANLHTATGVLDNITLVGQLAIYACMKPATTGLDYTIGKGSTVYYSGAVSATASARIEVSDGVTTKTSVVTGNHADGGWHDFLLIIDRDVDNVIQLFTDKGTGTATDISALLTLTNASQFTLGTTTSRIDYAFVATATSGIPTLRANGAQAIANIRAFTGRG